MALTSGSRLGPYEILSPLGAGGMGEVYRARDPRLKREVAVKMLSEALSRDAEHLARFEREAELLAALNHPAIAQIYGLEESAGSRFLVLELVEGETLAEKLTAGPLPVSEALEIGRQIAEALEAAHARGIVHRDLKPANVKVTPEGRVKVLDFGLAKNLAPASPADSVSPTLGPGATLVGTVLGTPAYMSPEQARGLTLDRRTDVWSFGCVLYEMLTGSESFGGDTVSDKVAAILRGEPDWNVLPRETPPMVRRLLVRCFEKEPNRRLSEIGEARWALEEVLAERRDGRTANAGRRSSPAASARAGVGASLLRSLKSAFGARAAAATPAPSAPPRLLQLTFAKEIEAFPAFSPDGARIAFAREVGRVRKIFVKKLDSGEESQVTQGPFDDIQPGWTADSGSLLFVRSRKPDDHLEPRDVFGQYDAGDVWSIEVASRKETLLVENAFHPSLSPDGSRIAVDASWAGPRRIWTVDSRGRNPEQVSTDVSEAVAHLRPRWSPDSERIVFQNVEGTRFGVRVLDVASKATTWVVDEAYASLDPVWSPNGRFIYFSSYRGGGINLWRVPVDEDGAAAGPAQQLTTGAGQDVQASLSRDGRKLAFATLKQNADLWKLPLSPDTGRPTGPAEEVVATTREDSRGNWSPDSRRIAFNSDRSGDMNVWLTSLDGGAPRQITRGAGGDFQPTWSPDGRRLAFFSSRSGHLNVWTAELESGRLMQLTRNRSIDINPFYSPDGRSIAYVSDQGGRLEVWAMKTDGSGARPLTSTGVLGHFLRWTRGGEKIVYRCPSFGGAAQTLAVSLAGGEPQPLPEVVGGAHMSLSPDFSRILDVLGHKTLWISPLAGGSPEPVFEFDDPDVRIDYPVWSPDGRWVLFDRFRPQGGDVWLMENLD
jgi:Tol biopolymer transport system component/serine/threonine protein kinase